MIGYQPVVLKPKIILTVCNNMIGYQPIVLNPNIPDFM